MTGDDVKPWTVRGVPPEVRNAALSAAKRSGMGVGDWLDRAIRHYVQHEKNASLEAQQPPQRPARTTETATKEAAELVGLIGELAAAGAPPPKGVSQQAYGLIRERLKALKAPKKAIGSPD